MAHKYRTRILALSFCLVNALAAQQKALLIPYHESALYGYADTSLIVKIPAQYSSCSFFNDGMAVVSYPTHDYNIQSCINSSGQQLLYSRKGNEVYNVGDGRCLAYFFKDSVSTSATKNRCLIDSSGHFYKLRDNVAVYCGGPKYVEPTIDQFSNGLLRAQCYNNSTNKWGYLGRNGKWVIKPRFDAAYSFCEDRAFVVYKHKLCVISTSGKIVFRLDSAKLPGNSGDELSKYPLFYSKGFCAVQKTDGTFIIVDINGNVTPVPTSVKNMGAFNFGRAVVQGKQNGLYTYINTKGELASEFQFDELESYCNAYSLALKKGEWLLIDSSAQVKYSFSKVGPIPTCEGILSILPFASNIVVKDFTSGKKGICSRNGNMITELIYEDLWTFDSGLSIGYRDSKYYLISNSGKESQVLPTDCNNYKINEFGYISCPKGITDLSGRKFWE